MGSFTDTLRKFAKEPERIGTAVYRRSVELLADEMQRTKPNGGRVPVDTGNLYRSLLASTTGMPKTAQGPFPGFDVGTVTATLKLGQPLWLGYQAVYSRVANYGLVGPDKLGRAHNREGNYFVEHAIAQWPALVEKAVREIER